MHFSLLQILTKIIQKTSHSLAAFLLIICAVGSVVGIYYLYKYFYPPVLAYPDSELGKQALIKTNFGLITITLQGKSRQAIAQFTRLAKNGWYDQTHFHRIVPNLLIEAGDPLTKDVNHPQLWGHGGSQVHFPNETYLSDSPQKGAVGMVSDQTQTYGSQFFILTQDTPWMKGKYTFIGTVTDGMDVVTSIGNQTVTSLGQPHTPISLYSITIL